MKTITTGTKITFTETGDKFELIETTTGFDVKRIKLSKNITPEPYTFQELLDLYEAGKITIHGFEEADAALVKSILTNYIHTTEIESLKAVIQKLTTTNGELATTNGQLATANEKLTAENSELGNSNAELTATNKDLTTKNEKLNTALEAMHEQE